MAKQWTSTDRLSYPVIHLPYQLSAPNRQFFSNRLVWIGLATSGSILSVNYLNRIFPQVPQIPLSIDLKRYFTESPWNAIGWTPFNVIFNYIGLGFFVPLDILFSCWFFLLIFKFQQILGKIVGFQGMPNFPYSYEQSSGGYLAVGLIALWLTRRHLKWVGEILLGGNESRNLPHGSADGYYWTDESNLIQPLSRYLSLGGNIIFFNLLPDSGRHWSNES